MDICLYPACIKYLMSGFDVPEVMAVTRSNICKNGIDSLSRGATCTFPSYDFDEDIFINPHCKSQVIYMVPYQYQR
ncbi:hypothetical protein RDI58_015492 [Solanum bulbocastanum]|uniref:Uncharacterized protein n=1 Tax=Solanum bulbocastanum TaxID=147425 RepID=A0AAN8TL03_SOLBU